MLQWCSSFHCVEILKHRDRNTKFFHAYTSSRRRRNVVSMQEVNSTGLDQQEEIKKAFTKFYLDLFYNTSTYDIKLNWDYLFSGERPSLSELEIPFSEEEIEQALFSIAREEIRHRDLMAS